MSLKSTYTKMGPLLTREKSNEYGNDVESGDDILILPLLCWEASLCSICCVFVRQSRRTASRTDLDLLQKLKSH